MFGNSVAERKQKLAPLLGLRETPLPKNATFDDTVAARIRENRNAEQEKCLYCAGETPVILSKMSRRQKHCNETGNVRVT
jgi:hypothetical protein